MPWLPTRFSEKDVAESQRKFLLTLYNVYSFYVLYADIDGFNPLEYKNHKSENVMDQWIVSKLNTLVQDVTDNLDGYKITQAALAIEAFTEDLSNWYVRRNRSRFWSEELTEDKISAYSTLYNVLVTLVKTAAPFIPYLSETIYQNLVVGLNGEAEESIHFTAYPEADLSLIDTKLEEQMGLAYSLVKLGRSARNTSNMKNRQPLSQMLISEKELPEYYGQVIKDELNIKDVVLGADLSKFVNFELKPNLPVIGKTYGKLIPQIKKAINDMDQMELAQKVNHGEDVLITINEEEIILNQKNLLVTMQGLPGYAFAGEGELGVVLDTQLTDALKEEGDVREMISKIQNLRKESNFEVADKISLYVDGNDHLMRIMKEHEDHLKKEVLAVEVHYGESHEMNEFNINGENINMGVEVIK